MSAMAEPDITDVTAKLYKLLEPLEPDMRRRALAGALGMLGEPVSAIAVSKKEAAVEVDCDYPARAATWMKQNGVSIEQLAHVFHGSDLIAHQVPGSNKKEKTLNTYILTGIGQLVQTGEPRFDDSVAREACKSHGCYDSANHSNIIKARGNAFTGSKKSGWAVTTPSLKTGADLVKQIGS
jgi:hypothetical protein